MDIIPHIFEEKWFVYILNIHLDYSYLDDQALTCLAEDRNAFSNTFCQNKR